MREIIGRTDIQPALTEARGTVEAAARTLLQATLDEYEAGMEITERALQDVQPPAAVIAAFNDVLRARSAERRGGQERGRTCISRWAPYNEKTTDLRNNLRGDSSIERQ